MQTAVPSHNSLEFSQSNRKGRLFVVSGPSGVGKGTLLSRLYKRASAIVPSVSATTRAPRPGEVNGVNYLFMSREQFEADIKSGFFLEYAQYGQNYYGTPLKPVQEQLAHSLDVVLEIEVQGARQLRENKIEAVSIYIQPPTMEELERRLRGRATETEESIEKRLATAKAEQDAIPEYDYLITNDDLEAATEKLIAIVVAERCRVPKNFEKKPEMGKG